MVVGYEGLSYPTFHSCWKHVLPEFRVVVEPDRSSMILSSERLCDQKHVHSRNSTGSHHDEDPARLVPVCDAFLPTHFHLFIGHAGPANLIDECAKLRFIRDKCEAVPARFSQLVVVRMADTHPVRETEVQRTLVLVARCRNSRITVDSHTGTCECLRGHQNHCSCRNTCQQDCQQGDLGDDHLNEFNHLSAPPSASVVWRRTFEVLYLKERFMYINIHYKAEFVNLYSATLSISTASTMNRSSFEPKLLQVAKVKRASPGVSGTVISLAFALYTS